LFILCLKRAAKKVKKKSQYSFPDIIGEKINLYFEAEQLYCPDYLKLNYKRS